MSQTIINNVPPYTQANATGGQTVFGTNWTANAASDVIVYLTPFGAEPDDETQILSYPSQYSVSFVGALQEVQVTLVNPTTLNDIVTIIRMTPADRENLYSNTNFLPSMLNNDFGILTLVDQQAQLVNQSIAPRYNYSATIEPVVDTILPILTANQVWIKNNDNDGFIGLTIEGGQVGSGTVNIGSINQLAYYPANGNEVSGLATMGDGVLVTNPFGAPSISNTLPSGISGENMDLLTPDVTGGVINFPLINEPTLTDAILGTPQSGTLTNCTGLPSGTGIRCTNTNNSASSGQLGEFVSSVIAQASSVVALSNQSSNVTSISLTAGDWDVWGNITMVNLGSRGSGVVGWTSTISANFPDGSLYTAVNLQQTNPANMLPGSGVTVPCLRYSLAVTTTIYLSCFLINQSGNGTVCGGIYARRVR